MAVTFLARCLKDLEMFDDLPVCLAVFNSNALKLDSERTVSTSANARKLGLHKHWKYCKFKGGNSCQNLITTY